VRHLDAVALHLLARRLEVVLADLVAESARAAVDEDDDLAGAVQAEGVGDVPVVDRLDLLDFEEVVARAERADLVGAALARPLADLPGIGARHRAALLDRLEVLRPAEAAVDRPGGAARQQPLHLALLEPDGAA